MSKVVRATLGDVAKFINGLAFKPEDWEPTGSKIIRIQNLTDSAKPFNLTNRKVDPKYIVNPGDLLVSWSATLGVFEWSDKAPAVLNQHIFRVIPDENKVFKPFLKYALNRSVASMDRHTHGATMKHINRAEFLSTPIFLPTLPEQKRIAAILDKADAIRRKRQQAVKLTEELLRSVFLDMFGDPVTNPKGWESYPLGDVVQEIESGWSPVCEERPPADDEWGVLKLGAVTSCSYLDAESKALPAGTSARPDLEVKTGDLLFTRKNTYNLVAATALVFDTKPKLMLSDLIFRLKLKDSSAVIPEYLWALLANSGKRKQVQSLAGGSSGSMPNISKSKLMEQLIEVPPMALQKKYADILHINRNARNKLEAASQKSDILFTSLLQRAFRGEV